MDSKAPASRPRPVLTSSRPCRFSSSEGVGRVPNSAVVLEARTVVILRMPLQLPRRRHYRIQFLGFEIVDQIQGAGNTGRPLACHVRVDHRRLQTFMTQKHLDRANIDAAFDEMRCKTMA